MIHHHQVALYEYQHERVYLRQRKGFIKYALQHGYTLVPGYTFGESGHAPSLLSCP